jgi:putative transposase
LFIDDFVLSTKTATIVMSIAIDINIKMKEASLKYRHNKHSVGIATVHLVFASKRKKSVLVGNVARRLQDIFLELAVEKDWAIRALEIAPDHVHLFVEHPPEEPINSIVKAFKGRSSRYLRQEFPHLLKLPSLWTHDYFYSTAGSVSAETIQRYINDDRHK